MDLRFDPLGKTSRRLRHSPKAMGSTLRVPGQFADFSTPTVILKMPRPPRKPQLSHGAAARGASPTRANKITNFSYATLPTFNDFDEPLSLPGLDRASRNLLGGLQQASLGFEQSQGDESARYAGRPSQKVDSDSAISGASVEGLPSETNFPFSSELDAGEFLWSDAPYIPKDGNICNGSECTAKTCASCISCEQSCYFPCDKPGECSSVSCFLQSCLGSPQTAGTGQHSPRLDHCEWVGNGENCEATVHSTGEAAQHVTESHIKPQSQITCEWDSCGISTDVNQLSSHLWTNHKPAAYICLWAGCEEAYCTHEELDAHFKLVHCNLGCHWAGCEMTTTSQTELQNHFNQDHLHLDDDYHMSNESSPHSPGRSSSVEFNSSAASVKDCSPSDEFAAIQTAEPHKSEMEGAKTCMWRIDQDSNVLCGLVCDNGNQLQEHLRTMHISGLRSTELQCGWAGCNYTQSTKDKSKLARHTYTHSKYCFGTCQSCHQEFSEKSKLEQHEATHLTDKPYVCTECNHGFPTQNSLTNHKRMHRGEKPLLCGMIVNGESCTYRCSDPSNMSTHKKKHLPPRFACSKCDRAFCRNDTLKRHMHTHDREKHKRKRGPVPKATKVRQ